MHLGKVVVLFTFTCMAGAEVLTAQIFFDYSSDEENYEIFLINTLLIRKIVPRFNLYMEHTVATMSDKDFASHVWLNWRLIHSVDNMVRSNIMLIFIFCKIYVLINEKCSEKRIKTEFFRSQLSYKMRKKIIFPHLVISLTNKIM